jgi:DNA-directed RNA polymerase subunit E"
VVEKACKVCHLITSKPQCPKCKSTQLTDNYTGVIIVLKTRDSHLARKLNLDRPGKYALKVR